MSDKEKLLRDIPSKDNLLNDPFIELLSERFSRQFLGKVIDETLDELRTAIFNSEVTSRDSLTQQRIVDRVGEKVAKKVTPGVSRVVNATGVILHTGLGRSPLAPEVLKMLAENLGGYCSLEIDRETGRRGQRIDCIRQLFQAIVACQDALVVNNNAGAVLITLETMAKGREVIVSRSELVEIGGSFRMPEVMAKSGCILREVGTTNRTYLSDYEQALSENSALILKVHPSNYKITGFVHSIEVKELANLAHSRNLPLMYDIGSGALIDTGQFGLAEEPMVSKALEDGADLVTFSCDKLLGGPQAGAIVGKGEYIAKLKKNPLYRALRLGKMSLAALEATLRLYLTGTFKDAHPLFKMLSASIDELRQRGQLLKTNLDPMIENKLELCIYDCRSTIGGGALAGQELPSLALIIKPLIYSVEQLASKLRHGAPPIFCRVEEDRVILDLRTVLPDEENLIIQAIQKILANH